MTPTLVSPHLEMLNRLPSLSRMPAGYRFPERVSLRAIGEVLRFEWRFILVCTIAFVLLGVVYCYRTPPRYEASVQIVPGDFTTKSTAIGANISGLAGLVLGGNTQSDSVKRFLTVLYSPDLARHLANDDRVMNVLVPPGKPGRLARLEAWLFGIQPQPLDYPRKVLAVESALASITFDDSKKSLSTYLRFQGTDRQRAIDFLALAIKQGDEALRQYNLSEIAYDDVFLNRAIANTQNIDVRLALSQNIVQTELRKMEANRSEYFSIRALGPVESPTASIWPKWNYVIGGMGILGLLLGTILAFARVYGRNGVGDDDDR